jgi:hypothetical protein
MTQQVTVVWCTSRDHIKLSSSAVSSALCDRVRDHRVLSHDRATRTARRPGILFLGYDPETVDFSDPALPPGMTSEKVHAGIAVAMKGFAEHGWEADVCFIPPDETAGPTVERRLGSARYDCVVIGAGVRLPPKRLAIFEAVINAVHKAAPGATIAFNTLPENSADAAARWLRNWRYQAITLIENFWRNRGQTASCWVVSGMLR